MVQAAGQMHVTVPAGGPTNLHKRQRLLLVGMLPFQVTNLVTITTTTKLLHYMSSRGFL